ncbi:MAG: hypothetical protein ACJ72E_13980, partial [Marmoricola sp.]
MLTDDDLTRELGAAFRSGTRDLTYTGRRTPRRIAPVAVPATAVALAVGALAVNGALGSRAADPTPAPSAHGAPTSSSAAPAFSADARTVTEKLDLAGFRFAYEVRSTDED